MSDFREPLDSTMHNVLASRLGQIALDAGNPSRKDVGDNIDRGLILHRLLEEHGFMLVIPKCTCHMQSLGERHIPNMLHKTDCPCYFNPKI